MSELSHAAVMPERMNATHERGGAVMQGNREALDASVRGPKSMTEFARRVRLACIFAETENREPLA